MPVSKLRRQIAWVAARLMHSREVAEYYQAKQKAARSCVRGWVKPGDLPSNAEIREQVQLLARLHDTTSPEQTLQAMRVRALWWMRQLAEYHPKLIGSVLTGGIREGSDIDLHVFANHAGAIADHLDSMGVGFEMERKRLVKNQELRVFTHIHVRDEFPLELTIYSTSQIGVRFRSSITGKPIEKASADDLEKLIHLEHGVDPSQLAADIGEMDSRPDRWNVFLALLLPLENVKQKATYHPEGDALFHSLQVFELARDEAAYDEDFLLAALLHDVGKAIDPRDHVAAGLEALDGFISSRTSWLIAHHMETHKIHDHSIGARRRRVLASHPDFESLLMLGDCDRGGRVPGVQTCTVEEALDYIEQLGEMFG
ncbi:HD domain-containing protein [Neorhodopirellula lusitana]|uniref:HD domain-containing protein n=1 Tax=Neorhodopirellula lusitana TaxID=445327 RepID=A0ABY1PT28_9BACT|nr:HD domain-containing protein [Neorhodopirellula lusitana]SMP46349.1 HD domain-containing protein [Neorhodopirellula lusitana]